MQFQGDATQDLKSNSTSKLENGRTEIRVTPFSLQSTSLAIPGFSALEEMELRGMMWKRGRCIEHTETAMKDVLRSETLGLHVSLCL